MATDPRSPKHRWHWVVALLTILTLAGPYIVKPVEKRIHFSMLPDEQNDASSGIVRLFRGFQMSLADICYAKSTLYQHRGIRYTLADENILGEELEEERTKTADEGTTAIAHHHDHESTGGQEIDITMIPRRKNDYRGILGNIEREVKPYAPEHIEHTQPLEALPWLRLATWINPEHENAWIATAFWLKDTAKTNPLATSQSIALLEHALALNSIRKEQVFHKQGLVWMLGHSYLFQAKQPAKALRVFQPALSITPQQLQALNETQQDWLEYTFRDAAQAYKKLGKHDEAIRVCNHAIELFPTSKPFYIMRAREQRQLKKK